MLLIYLISMLPNAIIHHHHEAIVFSEADSCEKAIYFGIQDEHKEHLSKIQDECQFCDQHTPTPQLLFDFNLNFLVSNYQKESFTWTKSVYFHPLINKHNKGPPEV